MIWFSSIGAGTVETVPAPHAQPRRAGACDTKPRLACRAKPSLAVPINTVTERRTRATGSTEQTDHQADAH